MNSPMLERLGLILMVLVGGGLGIGAAAFVIFKLDPLLERWANGPEDE